MSRPPASCAALRATAAAATGAILAIIGLLARSPGDLAQRTRASTVNGHVLLDLCRAPAVFPSSNRPGSSVPGVGAYTDPAQVSLPSQWSSMQDLATSPGALPDAAASAAEVNLRPTTGSALDDRSLQATFWGAVVAGLLFGLAWVVAATLLTRAPQPPAAGGTLLLLDRAVAVATAAPTFPPAAGQEVSLPDQWSRSRPGEDGSVWYRLRFDRPVAPADTLSAAFIERACTNLEVRLNGELVHRGGRLSEPLTRTCYHSHLVALPASLLRDSGNVLDIRVVGYALDNVTARQRAGGLSAVRIGPLPAMQALQDHHMFWNVTLAQIISGTMLILGGFALMLAWVRRLGYLMHFGLMSVGWALLATRMWVRDVPLPGPQVELLLCLAFAPIIAFAVKFLLGYAGLALRSPVHARADRVITLALWGQCLVMAGSFYLAGHFGLFPVARVWYTLFSLELVAAMGYFLWHAAHTRRAEFWLMCGVLGIVGAALGIENAYQNGADAMWGGRFVHLVMPLLFCAVGVRLIQVYARALQSAEGARNQLEFRIQQITAEIEHNFTQLAELRVEQIAERERKRIAADLHDDLGAKLLTIVHTSDNDRISTLAREALEEMRLSVRGLVGKPMQLPDALADWRAEVVSRLGQAGIDIAWDSPGEMPERPVSARIYVQTTRILREAVSNIIKHSGATHTVIRSEVDGDDFKLAIQDNGRGIPMELDGRLDRGHGMASMKNRAKQLQGQCLVESAPRQGTIIRLTLPLDPMGLLAKPLIP
jgi:signal transduction histidine kinase